MWEKACLLWHSKRMYLEIFPEKMFTGKWRFLWCATWGLKEFICKYTKFGQKSEGKTKGLSYWLSMGRGKKQDCNKLGWRRTWCGRRNPRGQPHAALTLQAGPGRKAWHCGRGLKMVMQQENTRIDWKSEF